MKLRTNDRRSALFISTVLHCYSYCHIMFEGVSKGELIYKAPKYRNCMQLNL
jgi:hypothetical protein